MTDVDLRIAVSVPATGAVLRFCRLAASAAASSVGFDLDELDDLRTAVGEAVGLLMGDDGSSVAVGPGAIELTFVLHPDAIDVEGTRAHPSLAAVEESELTAALLGATVDEYVLDLPGGRRWFRLVKRRSL